MGPLSTDALPLGQASQKGSYVLLFFYYSAPGPILCQTYALWVALAGHVLGARGESRARWAGPGATRR
ncbi:hypothetical protein [Candidatus Chloroploca sp. Khr17]|uniref:hypothetical protein n=1 Tax=Candidatus Chloroploca sp. Khr17 TaxID=2496869 RepID=UPI0013EBD39E|nr:hypothetical protein [Candidatus Chloroploca sp. Khr17]